MRGSAKEFRQIERQAGTFAETLTDTLSPSHRCSYRRGIPSPSLPDLIRQPALQQLGVGCRVEPGNDDEETLSGDWHNPLLHPHHGAERLADRTVEDEVRH